MGTFIISASFPRIAVSPSQKRFRTEPKQWEGLISLALGVFVALVAAGVVKARTTPEANLAFLRRFRWLLVLAALFLLIRGGTYLARLYW